MGRGHGGGGLSKRTRRVGGPAAGQGPWFRAAFGRKTQGLLTIAVKGRGRGGANWRSAISSPLGGWRRFRPRGTSAEKAVEQASAMGAHDQFVDQPAKMRALDARK